MALTVLSMSTACVDTTGDVVGSTSPTTLALATTTTTTSPITTTSSMVEATTTTSAFQEMAAGALITPTGVVVAILDRGNTGFIVRTPCDNTATVGNGEPVGQVAVVLDPGHGGLIDSGAVGSNGLREADANLTLALATERQPGRRPRC
ncbi:MAG: N-acetylmuramoyl-L-alanine amidase [Acidimicrobiia bacterium]